MAGMTKNKVQEENLAVGRREVGAVYWGTTGRCDGSVNGDLRQAKLTPGTNIADADAISYVAAT